MAYKIFYPVWNVAECKKGCKPAKYHLWCLNLFTWLSPSLSICLIPSIFPSSLTVIPCFHISQLSPHFIALHLPAYLISLPVHPSASLHLFLHLFYSVHMYFNIFFFHIPPFPSFFHRVKSLHISVLLHLSPLNPLSILIVTASTTLYHFSSSVYSSYFFLTFLMVSSLSLSLSVFFAAGIVRKKQWCEMVPCLEDEGCDLLVNKSGWTCTQPGGRVKTTTVSSGSSLAP